MWQKIKALFSIKSETAEVKTTHSEISREHQALPLVMPVEKVEQLVEESTPDLVPKKAVRSAARKKSETKEQALDVVAPVLDLNTAIRQILAPVLRADGFVGSGRNFRRISETWLTILNIETSRAGNAFTLNVGLHPCAFPDVLGKPLDLKKMKVQLCEFRARLTAQEVENWWQLDGSEAGIRRALEQALSCYQQTCRTQLAYLTGTDSPFVHASLAEFVQGAYDFSPFDAGDIRSVLLIARLHLAYQRTEIAQEFAHYGLQHVGNAVSIRREFEAINDDAGVPQAL